MSCKTAGLPKLYLAGPMGGLTWEEAAEWRNQVMEALKGKWTCISPVRPQAGDYDSKSIIDAHDQSLNEHIPLWHTATGLTTMDEFFIDQADWLLVNCSNVQKVSIGTVWECGYAWAKNKKILTVVQPGSVHDHPFVRRRSHVFTSDLNEAIEYLKRVTP